MGPTTPSVNRVRLRPSEMLHSSSFLGRVTLMSTVLSTAFRAMNTAGCMAIRLSVVILECKLTRICVCLRAVRPAKFQNPTPLTPPESSVMAPLRETFTIVLPLKLTVTSPVPSSSLCGAP